MAAHKRSRKVPKKDRVWQDSYSLGGAMLFLALISFTTISRLTMFSGIMLFLIGLFFIKHGHELQRSGKSSFKEWISIKIFQSLLFIVIGIIMLLILPRQFTTASILITLLGFVMFAYYKVRYYSGWNT